MSDNISKNTFSFVGLRVAIYFVIFVIIFLSSLLNAFEVGVIYNDYFIPESYTATSKILVEFNDAEDEREKASSLATDVSELFQSCGETLELIPAGYAVSISSISDTNFLSITVTGTDAQVCADTANALCEIAPEVFEHYYTGADAIPFDVATVPVNSDKDNNIVRLITAFFVVLLVIGVILEAVLILLIELILRRIKKLKSS